VTQIYTFSTFSLQQKKEIRIQFCKVKKRQHCCWSSCDIVGENGPNVADQNSWKMVFLIRPCLSQWNSSNSNCFIVTQN